MASTIKPTIKICMYLARPPKISHLECLLYRTIACAAQLYHLWHLNVWTFLTHFTDWNDFFRNANNFQLLQLVLCVCVYFCWDVEIICVFSLTRVSLPASCHLCFTKRKVCVCTSQLMSHIRSVSCCFNSWFTELCLWDGEWTSVWGGNRGWVVYWGKSGWEEMKQSCNLWHRLWLSNPFNPDG